MEFELPPKSLPVWETASKRVQDGYAAAFSDCTVVAVRLLLVFKNIKQTSCFNISNLGNMIQYLNSHLQLQNERLINTFNESTLQDEDIPDGNFERLVIDVIKGLYTRKTTGFLYFRNSNPANVSHVVAFLYNFAEDTLDFFEKDSNNKIGYTSIKSDNQDESIYNLFFNFYSDDSDLVLNKVYETQPIGVGGSKKCRKCGLTKY